MTKNSNMLKYQIGFQLWKAWMMIWMDINRARVSIRTNLQPQRVWVIMNWNSINHGLMKSTQSYYIK